MMRRNRPAAAETQYSAPPLARDSVRDLDRSRSFMGFCSRPRTATGMRRSAGSWLRRIA
jgi:hypothetical protein